MTHINARGKTRLLRAERGRQLADLRQQGYDYRPRQQVCINKQLTRQKMQKFRL